jgi:hypothetical protein
MYVSCSSSAFGLKPKKQQPKVIFILKHSMRLLRDDPGTLWPGKISYISLLLIDLYVCKYQDVPGFNR